MVYRGKKFRFDGGAGKSDREAKKRAEMEWRQVKARIDLEAEESKPNWGKYQAALSEWETVRQWCRGNPGAPMAEQMERLATAKIEQLRQRLEAEEPESLHLDDVFNGQFLVRESPQEHLARVMQSLSEPDRQIDAIAGAPEPEPPLSTLDVEKAIWEERLSSRQSGPKEMTVGHQVDRFIADKAASVAAGELSQGRLNELRIYLRDFADWRGRETPVIEISGQVLLDYRLELLAKVERDEWTTTTANHRMIAVKAWVRWLWHAEVIPSLPRVLDGKSASLRIGKSQSAIVVFTREEIATLLERASDRTRLYLLLMLNCGMTQKDIADLQHGELDWGAGRITRKRSKTKKHDNVPEVSYLLWPETLRLLHQESSDGAAALLLNASGQRIWMDKVTGGKYQKNDNVRSAFARLCKKTKIKKPLKSLKKTSATLLRGNPHYASIESLFLGHAAGTIAHKHYSQAPQLLLDDAIGWLGRELGIATGV